MTHVIAFVFGGALQEAALAGLFGQWSSCNTSFAKAAPRALSLPSALFSPACIH